MLHGQFSLNPQSSDKINSLYKRLYKKTIEPPNYYAKENRNSTM